MNPVLLYGLIVFACLAALAVTVRRAGYSHMHAFLMFIPGVNLIWLFVFAVADWPVLRDYARRRLEDGDADDADVERLLHYAARLDDRGATASALQLYDLVIRHRPDTPAANDATVMKQTIRDEQLITE